MNYIKLPYMDSKVCAFDVCQAHQQLESDHNKGGILWERPSNRRRNASTGVQLARMKYSSSYRWVDILNLEDDADSSDKDVRDIYLINVIKWGLPIDAEMQAVIATVFCPDFVAKFK